MRAHARARTNAHAQRSKAVDLPKPVEREERKPQGSESEQPENPLDHALSCLDSIACSLRAMAIINATLHRESLESEDAEKIKDLLDL